MLPAVCLRMAAFAVITLLVFCLLTSCNNKENRAILQQLSEQNTIGTSPLCIDSVKKVADYFNRWGTSNERMQANYLLGCAYKDCNEAPMAIHFFKEAISKADTTDNDCNYALLSRAYGQMAQEFYNQFFVQEQLEALEKSCYYAWKGGDTLVALICNEYKIYAFTRLNMPDSVIYYAELSANEYREHGYNNNAAIAQMQCVDELLDRNETDKAKQYINQYEQESGYFDSLGNITKGREIFYHKKGRYYLGINHLDSAEYCFRKELKEGKDFNNQNAGAIGLAELFTKKHLPDSAAKYALYGYAMNDSLIKTRVTAETAKAQSLYDYTRFQKKAYEEEQRANQTTHLLFLTGLMMMIGIVITYKKLSDIRRKEREQQERFLQNLRDLDKAQTEVMNLKTNANSLKEIISEKEHNIRLLSEKIREYQAQKTKNKKDAEIELQENTDFKHLQNLAAIGALLSDKELSTARMLVMQYFPELYVFLSKHLYQLNPTMYHTCILLRLHFPASVISNFLGVSPGYISQIRAEMLSTLFNIEGNQKVFDAMIRDFK